MCKLLAITNLKKVKVTKELLMSLAKIIGDGQRDGLGFILSSNDNAEIYHRGHDTKRSIEAMKFKAYQGELYQAPMSHFSSNIADLKEENNDKLIMHGRISTNSISLEACHPFKIKDSYFAHNGVVNVPLTHGYDTITDNDSEFLAHDFFNRGKKAIKEFSGYAAFMQLQKNILKIYRDDNATLFFSYSETLQCYIFTTKYDDALKICELLADDFTLPVLLKDETFVTFNGQKMTFKKISRPKVDWKIDSKLLEKSLGRQFPSSENKSKFISQFDDYDEYVEGYGHYNDDDSENYDDYKNYSIFDDNFDDDDFREHVLDEIEYLNKRGA